MKLVITSINDVCSVVCSGYNKILYDYEIVQIVLIEPVLYLSDHEIEDFNELISRRSKSCCPRPIFAQISSLTQSLGLGYCPILLTGICG